MNGIKLLGLGFVFVCPVFAQDIPGEPKLPGDVLAATESVVALDQGLAVRKDDLREYIRTIQKVLEIRPFYGYAGPEKAVRSLLLNRRLSEQAIEAGVRPDDFDLAVSHWERRLLVLMVLDQLEEGIDVSLADMEQYYQDHPEEFLQPERRTFRHIFLEVAPGADEKQRQTILERLLALRERAEQGEDFAQLARASSEVPSASQGGLVEQAAAKDFRVQEFVDAAFHLEEGQLSEPIQTRYGYHLVLMTRIHPRETLSLDEVIRRGRLQQWLKTERASQQLQDILAKMNNLWPVDRHFEVLDHLEGATEKALLFEIAGKPFRLADLRVFFGELPDFTEPSGRKEVGELLDVLINLELTYRYALEQKLDQSLEFRRRMDHLKRYSLAQTYLTHQVDHSPRLSEGRLREYYEANRGRFVSERAVEVSRIFCAAGVNADTPRGERYQKMRAALQRAAALRQRLMSGADFAEVARQESDDAHATAGGRMGKVVYGTTSAPFEVAAFALDAGEISAPVELDNGYALIRVEKHYPRQRLTFEEARPRVVDFIRATLYEQLEEEGWQGVLGSGEVQIFSDRVRRVWEE